MRTRATRIPRQRPASRRRRRSPTRTGRTSVMDLHASGLCADGARPSRWWRSCADEQGRKDPEERDHEDREEARRPASPPRRPRPPRSMPKLVSITPTVNLIVFSGTRSSGLRTSTPTTATSNDRRRGACNRDANRPCAAAEADHDEHDLEPFEEDALERDRERVPVDPPRSAGRRHPRPPRALCAKRLVLVVERLVAARAQYRLT